MNASLARNWWAVLLRGIATLLFGVIAFLMPGITIASLVLVFAVYMLADGVLTIISALKAARRQERWGLLVLEGIADLAAGAVALLAPAAALLVFVAIAIAWAVISGALMLFAGFRLKRDHGRIWQILGGVASIAWGVLLAMFPVSGLVVLTWWLGAYALIFGGTMIALAFSLRSHQHDVPVAMARPA